MRKDRSASYLTGSIDNLGGVVLALVSDHLAEGVLNGRVVALDEVAVDELDCERGFACVRRDMSHSQQSRN